MSEDTIPPDPNCYDCREGNAHEHEQTYRIERRAMSEIEDMISEVRHGQMSTTKAKTIIEAYCNRQVIGGKIDELQQLPLTSDRAVLEHYIDRIATLKSKLGEE